MTQEIQQHTGSQLAIHDDQAFWTDQQLAALRQLGVDANSQGDLAVFFHQAQRSGLDPFKREIYMITRKGKPTIQTGIDGFYKIADRVSRATGGTWGISETLWCGQDGQWADVWLQSGPPAAAKVTLERNGARFTVVALTSEYMAQGPMWQKMPARMIAKCAEALAIRKAFPEDLSGLYTSEEMAQADSPTPAPRPASIQQVQEPAPVQVSGRDWLEELNQVDTLQASRDLYMECSRAGEMTEELRAEFITVGSVLAETEKNQQPVADVATGEIIEEAL